MKRIATYRDFLGELTVTYRRTEKPSTKITCSKVAEEFIRPYFDQCMDDHEEVKIIHLNNSNYTVNVHDLSKGGLTGCLIDVRLAVRQALQICCTGVILVHNHPSSSLKPSEPDKQITQKLKKAMEYFDIKLLDHIIITRESYCSMADEGLL